MAIIVYLVTHTHTCCQAVTQCCVLSVSEVSDRGGDISGQPWRQQSALRHPRYGDALVCSFLPAVWRWRCFIRKKEQHSESVPAKVIFIRALIFSVMDVGPSVFCCCSHAAYPPPGLDYVSHEDILPYYSTEQIPIQHELFERFLMYNPTKCECCSVVCKYPCKSV